MGVSGCGKTEVGEILAEKIGALFIEGDDFHSPSNIQKMSQSIPLDDADRRVWLKTLRKLIDKQLELSGYTVLACSALKTHYRHLLQDNDPRVKFVYLKGSPSLIKKTTGKKKRTFHETILIEKSVRCS